MTIFTDFSIVSVYSVYKIVVNGLTNLVAGVIGNTEATFGNALASEDKEKFDTEFKTIDLISKIVSTTCYGTCIALICQFVSVYTSGVNDADYYRPVFALFLCASEWIYCMGLTYNNVIVSVGHFKQTTRIGVCEALINIVLSLVLVFWIGLTGVVIATTIAMAYKLIANTIYMRKNIYKVSISYIVRSLLAETISIVVCYVLSLLLVPEINGYFAFAFAAIPTFVCSLAICSVISFLFCRQESLLILNKLLHRKNA